MDAYNRPKHAESCDCSVCWSKVEIANPATGQSKPCDQCRPASASRVRITQMRLIGGAWKVQQAEWSITPAFTCEKHMPSDRPPKYWSVVENIGKPVPFVPLYEPFELVV